MISVGKSFRWKKRRWRSSFALFVVLVGGVPVLGAGITKIRNSSKSFSLFTLGRIFDRLKFLDGLPQASLMPRRYHRC
jgi:hypothetical protein